MPWLDSLVSLFPSRLRHSLYERRQCFLHGKTRAKHVKYLRRTYLPASLQKIREIVPKEFLDAYLELFEDFDPLNQTDRTPHPVHWPGYPHPLLLRKHSSDIPVFCQVFVDEQYEPAIHHVGHGGTVLDCGANTGLSAAWFLWKLTPRCVLALEPEPNNLAMCIQNLAPWGDRVRVVEGGLWHTGGLALDISNPRLEWSFQCRGASTAQSNGPQTYTLTQLIQLANASTVDLLKIDIEGAEADVFGIHWDQHCLSTVRNMAIEFHGEACEKIFRNAVLGLSFNESFIGDVTWITDLRTDLSHQSLTSPQLRNVG